MHTALDVVEGRANWSAEAADCPPGGIVLDCFAGSGTTLAVAVKNGRRAIGCDVREEMRDLARKRVSGIEPNLFGQADGGGM